MSVEWQEIDTSGSRTPRGDTMHVMPRCPACGQPEQIVWVHGHGQCAHCHMNIMPCCDGAVSEPE